MINFPKSFKNLLSMFLVMLLYKNPVGLAQTDPNNGFHDPEREALLALKKQLNSPSLNGNWTGLMCYLNDPPRWSGLQCVNGRVTGLVLEDLGLSGTIRPHTFFNLTELSVLSFKNNSLSGNLMDFSNNQKLTQIDMSGNHLDGEIPDSLLKLTGLESLQLQDNSLTGRIPGFNQSSLKVFNVSYNNLSGAIPNTTVLQSFEYSCYVGNENLCGNPTPIPCNIISQGDSSSSDSDDHKKSSSAWLSIIVVVNIVVLVVLVFLVIIYYKKYKKLKNDAKSKSLPQTMEERDARALERWTGKGVAGGEEKGKLIFVDRTEARFELEDLMKASAEGLGKGNFGNCYKAMLVDGPTVVVKRLRDLKPLTRDEFLRQMVAIADLKHPNLLPLLAFYYSSEEKLLVQKYASNGNLYNRIHGGRRTNVRVRFRWSSRLSAARGVARALEYLHLNTTPSSAIVPHGNLRSSNVLFDENDTVLLSDYGLNSLLAVPIASQRMVSYRSPEYKAQKEVSKKSDVWSYGCLLLELLTGKLPAHSAPQGVNGVDLCNWVHRAVREEWTAEIFDMEIAGQRSANNGMVSLMQIAMSCCDKSPEKRPEMSEVVREVENIKVAADSEDEEDLSLDQSLTDDSVSATP